jgi:hypothetical protein
MKEVRTMTQGFTDRAQQRPQGSPAIVLWLFALMIAEIEVFLWLFERWYS